MTHHFRILPSLTLLRACLLAASACLLLACGGGDGGAAAAPSPPGPGVTPPAASVQADVTLLFMGNSHTALNNLPGMVAALLRTAQPGKSVAFVQSPHSMLLNERGSHEPSLGLLASQKWSYVVLQAQDYSSSGLFIYPTTGAEKLVQLARAQGSQPILFAEWPRRGIDESARIYSTYARIARVQPACLPPIPQAFDLAARLHPTLELWDADANHSAPNGAFLAAVLLTAAIDPASPANLGLIAGFGVEAQTQEQLKQVAQEILTTQSARQFCSSP